MSVEVRGDRSSLRTFGHVLANVAVANLTTGLVWFSLTFWVYLSSRSVLVTGILGGVYMIAIASVSLFFGTLVDRHRKHAVMVASSAVTIVAFGIAGLIYVAVPEPTLFDLGQRWFWIFAATILVGVVVEHLRNIALSTTVTLLVDEERRPRANGVVGAVQGVAFIGTSVVSGLAVGFLGMGWVIGIALVAITLAGGHLLVLRIPEERPRAVEGGTALVDVRGSIAAVRATPGLFGLLLFTTVNNMVAGVYMALMDPYGLELFSVQAWGIVFGLVATGYIVGGLVVARFGLGRRPLRTMILAVALAGAMGSVFTLRDWPALYIVGNWLIMVLGTVTEAAEQSTIQSAVPLERQGRVFGLAVTLEAAAAPIVSFLVAPLAELVVIPWVESEPGRQATGLLLGGGDGRGIALMFVVSNALTVLVALAALRSTSYAALSRRLDVGTVKAPSDVPGNAAR